MKTCTVIATAMLSAFILFLVACGGETQRLETPQKTLPTTRPSTPLPSSAKPTNLPRPPASSGPMAQTIDPNCTYEFASEPANRTTGVPKDTSISISSDVAMNVATIGSASLVVTGAVSGAIHGTTMTPTSGTVASIEFHPDENLSRGEMITVSFQPDLDPCKSILEDPYVFQFVVDTEGYVPSFTKHKQALYGQSSLDTHIDKFLNGGEAVLVTEVGSDGHVDIIAAAGRERVTRLKVSTTGQVNEHFLNIRDVTEIEGGEFCGDVTRDDLLINDIPGSAALICDVESSTSLSENQDQKFSPSYKRGTNQDCRTTTHQYLPNMSVSNEEDMGVCGSFIGDIEIGDFNGDGHDDLLISTTMSMVNTEGIVFERWHFDGALRIQRNFELDSDEVEIGSLQSCAGARIQGDWCVQYLWLIPFDCDKYPEEEASHSRSTEDYSYSYCWKSDGKLELYLGGLPSSQSGSPTVDTDIVIAGSNLYCCPQDLELGDLDGDGDLDVFSVSQSFLSETYFDWTRGYSTFINLGVENKNTLERKIRLARKDTFIGSDPNFPYLNSHIKSNLMKSQQFYQAAVLGDVDMDGDLDAITVGIAGAQLLTNDGTGNFSTGAILHSHPTQDVSLADFDKDGDLDAVFANYHPVPIGLFDHPDEQYILNNLGAPDKNKPNRIYLNDGFGVFTNSTLNIGIHNTFALGVGDFDGDSDNDIFFLNDGSGNEIWFNDLYQPSPVPDPTGLKTSQTPGPSSNIGMSAGPADMPRPPKEDSTTGDSSNLPSGSGTTTGAAGLPTGDQTYPSSDGTTTGSANYPKSPDDGPNPILPSGTTTLVDDVTTGNVWIKEVLESGPEDAGQMVRMAYESFWTYGQSDRLHMIYQVREGTGPKKIFYKSYDVQSSTHDASERITDLRDGDEHPGDIKSECGVLNVDDETPVCISYYYAYNLWGAWYREAADSGSSFSPEGPWRQKNVDDDGNIGEYSSILIDTSGLAHMIYYSDTDNDLMHISQADSDSDDGKSNWRAWGDSKVIDGVFTGRDKHAGQYATALIHKKAIRNNEVEEIHVLYRTSDKRISHLYSISDNANDSEREWKKTTVASDGWTKSHISFDLDSNGNPHVVYHHSAVNDLMYAWANQNVEGEWVWQVEAIDTKDEVGTYASIVMQPGSSIDKPHVSYYDKTHHALKYATKMFNPKLGVTTWVTETVDNPAEIAQPVALLTVGKFTDIIVADDGTIYIAYYDETTGNLKLAHN